MSVKAVELVRAIRDRQAEDTRTMTPEQRRAYYLERAAELRKKLQERATAGADKTR
jgi:hypothetical protein